MKTLTQVRHFPSVRPYRTGTVIIQILSFTFTIAMTATGVAAAPSGYIVTFTVPGCVNAGGTVGMETAESTSLLLNECENIRLFTSFEGGINAPCPNGKDAMIMAYPNLDCGGNPVSTEPLPNTRAPGQCKEIVVNLSGGELAGGRSAKFTCV